MWSLKQSKHWETYAYDRWLKDREPTSFSFIRWVIGYKLWIVTTHQYFKLVCWRNGHDYKDGDEMKVVLGDTEYPLGSYEKQCLRCGKIIIERN